MLPHAHACLPLLPHACLLHAHVGYMHGCLLYVHVKQVGVLSPTLAGCHGSNAGILTSLFSLGSYVRIWMHGFVALNLKWREFVKNQILHEIAVYLSY